MLEKAGKILTAQNGAAGTNLKNNKYPKAFLANPSSRLAKNGPARARKKSRNRITHPEGIAERHVLFARREVWRSCLVTIRHGVHQTSLSRHLVHLVCAVDEIRHIVPEIAHRRERIDVSRRRLLSSPLLLGERHTREQIFFHARARFRACVARGENLFSRWGARSRSLILAKVVY